MKNSLKFRRSTTALLTLITLTVLGNLCTYGAERGQPMPPPGGFGGAMPTIDPATGLPLPQTPPWKDPEWKDPDKRLEIAYDGLPVGEVAKDLRKQFNDAFDIVIPTSWQPVNNSVPFDATSVPIRVQLKNVTASEVFNALNLMFEAENTPLHWELVMNGSRPTVLLRVQQMLLPRSDSPQPDEQKRRIFFVGEMVGDQKAGGMTIEDLVKTVSEVYEMSYGNTRGAISDHLQFHKQAQLLIVTGTIDQINFITETLSALRQKVDRSRQAARAAANEGQKAEPKPNVEKPKAP